MVDFHLVLVSCKYDLVNPLEEKRGIIRNKADLSLFLFRRSDEQRSLQRLWNVAAITVEREEPK